jgi:hypothetical protein
MRTLTRRETITAAVAVAAAQTLPAPPAAATVTDAPATFNLSEPGIVVSVMADYVRRQRTEAGVLAPDLDRALDLVLHHLDIGAHALQEAAALARG